MPPPAMPAQGRARSAIGAADTELTAAVGALIRALRGLGGAGHVELASRLAGHAWSGLRTDNPRAADRFNGLLHHLARLPAGEAAQHTPSNEEKR